jgi:hypothetical protein
MLLRPASASRSRRGRRRPRRSGGAPRTRRGLPPATRQARDLSFGNRFARELHRGREPRKGVGILVGEGEEAIGQARSRVRSPTRGDRRAGRTFGRPIDSAADHRDEAGSEARRRRPMRCPPPGTGAGDASSSTNPPRVRSRKRVSDVSATAGLYGCDSVARAHGSCRWYVGTRASVVPARPPEPSTSSATGRFVAGDPTLRPPDLAPAGRSPGRAFFRIARGLRPLRTPALEPPGGRREDAC